MTLWLIVAGRPETLTLPRPPRGPGRCELTFQPTGLPGDAVAGGWRHFLASLAAYAEGETGHPFGADRDSGR